MRTPGSPRIIAKPLEPSRKNANRISAAGSPGPRTGLTPDFSRSRSASLAPVADFDPSAASIARVYDYLLAGKDNFAADRAVAERLLAVAPLTAVVTRENRQFLARAVTWTANREIGQFIDLGCGMPTVPNTHETARAIDPGARVAYVDNDPVVLSHLCARAAKGDPGVT